MRYPLPFSRWTLATLLLVSVGCKDSVPRDSSPALPHSVTATRALTPATEQAIVNFCADCHVMPDPASFPKTAWDSEVRRGYDFYYASGRADLEVPIFADAQHYFASRAPESLELPPPGEVDTELLGQFQSYALVVEGLTHSAVSFIDVVELGSPLGRGILFSEMKGGGVYFAPLAADGQATAPQLLGKVAHPAVVRVTDWDNDGLNDLIVADLGSFLPEDHQRGRVVWFRQDPEALGTFKATTLQDGVGRVASVEVADLNSDGQPDLLVAEFGWQTTGSIFWLKRAADGAPVEGLSKHVIDPRAGTIHVPVVDLNGDGHLDFVALISQHHERIEAMINDGSGQFQSKLLYAAPEPAFGSSGIELVDFNGNGKLDVLFTNGDSFDSFILKPSHGVRWLENKGALNFEVHEIGKLPGAHRALLGDFDGDGQTEIVGGSFFAKDVLRSQGLENTESLVIWSRGAGEFEKRVLSRGNCTHAALHVADLDNDGRDDFLAGEFGEGNSTTGAVLTVWLSR